MYVWMIEARWKGKRWYPARDFHRKDKAKDVMVAMRKSEAKRSGLGMRQAEYRLRKWAPAPGTEEE